MTATATSSASSRRPATGSRLRHQQLLLCGAAVLGWSFNVDPGGAAASTSPPPCWPSSVPGRGGADLAAAAARTGPSHLAERSRGGGGDAQIGLGVGLATVFVLGAVVVRQIDVLGHATDTVLDFARRGAGPAIVAVARS